MFKASLSNKSKQKLGSLNSRCYLHAAFFEAFLKPRGALFAFMGKETLDFFVGSTVRLLQSHAACQPGVLLVQASSGSAGILLMVQDSQCMSGALFV